MSRRRPKPPQSGGRRLASALALCYNPSTRERKEALWRIPPQVLGKYRILRELGRGSFGIVFLAEDTALRNRRVALKVLHPQRMDDPASLGRFQDEAGTLAQLEHPHIVTVYEAGEIEGRRIIAMRYIEGQTLAEVLASEGPQPVERVAGWLDEVAAALDYAHGQRVLHQDIKPSNVLLDARGHAVVGDFGLAHAVEASGGSMESEDRKILSGTAKYMAPEQARGAPVPESDVYSLGIVAYELLTGQVPFEGKDPFAIALRHMTERPRAPREVQPALPKEVEAVVLRALSKEPAQRFRTPGEMARAFGEAAEGSGSRKAREDAEDGERVGHRETRHPGLDVGRGRGAAGSAPGGGMAGAAAGRGGDADGGGARDGRARAAHPHLALAHHHARAAHPHAASAHGHTRSSN